jgi:hypothetical protein
MDDESVRRPKPPTLDDAGLLLLFVAVAGVLWSLIGDRAEPGLNPFCQDRFLAPVVLGDAGVATVGGAAGALGLVALAVLLRRTAILRQGQLRPLGALLVVAAAVLVAATYRVMTSRGCGAPIGQILVIPPALLVLPTLLGPGLYLWLRPGRPLR